MERHATLSRQLINSVIHTERAELPKVDLNKLAQAIEDFCLENLRNPRSREMEKMIEECKL